MKFKKGDTIVMNDNGKYSSMGHAYALGYEVKDIANGDLFEDKYYILSTGTNQSMHDVITIDHKFNFSLKDTLKKL